jgi:hypothetical protein
VAPGAATPNDAVPCELAACLPAWRFGPEWLLPPA